MKFLFLSPGFVFGALISGAVFAEGQKPQATSFGNLSEATEVEVPNFNEFEEIHADEHELFERSYEETIEKGDFSSKRVRAYDPVNKRHYQQVIVGKTKKASMFAGYDYWRYVTVYNVDTVSERVAYLPYYQEECHDASWAMAEWGESRSLKVSLSSTVGADALGLKASVTMSIEAGVTFSTSRRIQAVKGIKALHYPYKMSDEWKGVTYIQTYSKDGNRYGYLSKLGGFDRLKEYPHEFHLDNQNVGFKIKRKVLEKCPGYDPDADRVDQSLLYIR